MRMTGDDGEVQGAVGAAVATAVEAMAPGLARGGTSRHGAAEHREARLAAHAVGILSGRDEQLAGDLRADTAAGKQARVYRLDQRGDRLVELADLVVELGDSPGEAA